MTADTCCSDNISSLLTVEVETTGLVFIHFLMFCSLCKFVSLWNCCLIYLRFCTFLHDLFIHDLCAAVRLGTTYTLRSKHGRCLLKLAACDCTWLRVTVHVALYLCSWSFVGVCSDHAPLVCCCFTILALLLVTGNFLCRRPCRLHPHMSWANAYQATCFSFFLPVSPALLFVLSSLL